MNDSNRNQRAPSVHVRAVAPDSGQVPTIKTHDARRGVGSRTMEIVWHAEGVYSIDRCFIAVHRRGDGTPMIEISAPEDSRVTVAYDGPLEGVEDVTEGEDTVDERDVIAGTAGER